MINKKETQWLNLVINKILNDVEKLSKEELKEILRRIKEEFAKEFNKDLWEAFFSGDIETTEISNIDKFFYLYCIVGQKDLVKYSYQKFLETQNDNFMEQGVEISQQIVHAFIEAELFCNDKQRSSKTVKQEKNNYELLLNVVSYMLRITENSEYLTDEMKGVILRRDSLKAENLINFLEVYMSVVKDIPHDNFLREFSEKNFLGMQEHYSNILAILELQNKSNNTQLTSEETLNLFGTIIYICDSDNYYMKELIDGLVDFKSLYEKGYMHKAFDLFLNETIEERDSTFVNSMLRTDSFTGNIEPFEKNQFHEYIYDRLRETFSAIDLSLAENQDMVAGILAQIRDEILYEEDLEWDYYLEILAHDEMKTITPDLQEQILDMLDTPMTYETVLKKYFILNSIEEKFPEIVVERYYDEELELKYFLLYDKTEYAYNAIIEYINEFLISKLEKKDTLTSFEKEQFKNILNKLLAEHDLKYSQKMRIVNKLGSFYALETEYKKLEDLEINCNEEEMFFEEIVTMFKIDSFFEPEEYPEEFLKNKKRLIALLSSKDEQDKDEAFKCLIEIMDLSAVHNGANSFLNTFFKEIKGKISEDERVALLNQFLESHILSVVHQSLEMTDEYEQNLFEAIEAQVRAKGERVLIESTVILSLIQFNKTGKLKSKKIKTLLDKIAKSELESIQAEDKFLEETFETEDKYYILEEILETEEISEESIEILKLKERELKSIERQLLLERKKDGICSFEMCKKYLLKIYEILGIKERVVEEEEVGAIEIASIIEVFKSVLQDYVRNIIVNIGFEAEPVVIITEETEENDIGSYAELDEMLVIISVPTFITRENILEIIDTISHEARHIEQFMSKKNRNMEYYGYLAIKENLVIKTDKRLYSENYYTVYDEINARIARNKRKR